MNDNSLFVKPSETSVAVSELDRAMQSYIDSGRYSKEELAEIRKREANKLKEAKKTNGVGSAVGKIAKKALAAKQEKPTPSLTPWGGGKTQMQANFQKNEEGEIVEGTSTEEAPKKEKQRESLTGSLVGDIAVDLTIGEDLYSLFTGTEHKKEEKRKGPKYL